MTCFTMECLMVAKRKLEREMEIQVPQIERVLLPPKKKMSFRLDPDVLEWFQEHRGYQKLVNAILRAYMEQEKRREEEK